MQSGICEKYRIVSAKGLIALIAAVAYCPLVVSAATDNWTDGTGNWNLSTNWTTPPSTHNVPAGTDTVNITPTDGVSRTITYDFPGAVTLGSLTIDLTGGSGSATTTLSMAANALTSNSEVIGNSGSGTFVQSGGTNTDNGGFDLGNANGSTGAYTLSGTGALVANSGEAVGLSGAGIFTQAGGTNTVASGNLNIAFNTNATGSYALSDGTINVTTGNVNVGGSPSAKGGSGTLTVTGDGILNTASNADITLYNSTGSGLTLSGGGTINTGYLNIPSGNTALFTWTSGTLNWNSTTVNAIIDNSSSANLATNLSLGSSQTLSVLSSEYVGYNGAGTVNQTGGSNTLGSTSTLYVANASAATGTYTLSGGSLTANAEDVGVAGKGSFTHSAGTNAITTTLTVGDQNGSTGTYTLSASGSLSAAYETIGNSGNGTFTQNGGTNTMGGVDAYLVVGSGLTSVGTYTLNGGSLILSKTSEGEYIGYSGQGTFNQTGGTNTFSGGDDILCLGQNSGSGKYVLSGGNLTGANTAQELLGNGGSGVFIQTGGTNTVSTLALSNGSYSLSGTGVLIANEVIGISGQSTFTQSGGNNIVNAGSEPASLTIGMGSSGSYLLSGGTLSVTGDEIVGYVTTTAFFTQTGGVNTATGDLDIAYSRLSGGPLTGTFTISGGSSTFSGSAYIGGSFEGPAGDASLTVSGTGVLTIAGTLIVFGNRTINLSGGTLNAGALSLGGNLNWTAGTLNFTSD
ncbi:MAG TPA: hypothetical protein VGG19_18315, partial [Tepidisphaeraceae bacterium]